MPQFEDTEKILQTLRNDHRNTATLKGYCNFMTWLLAINTICVAAIMFKLCFGWFPGS